MCLMTLVASLRLFGLGDDWVVQVLVFRHFVLYQRMLEFDVDVVDCTSPE